LKKILVIFLVLFALFFGLYSYSAAGQRAPLGYCAFCDRQVLDVQKFYEDDLVIALCTHKPIVSGHSLIIPKRHCRRFEELTDAETACICEVIKKVHGAVLGGRSPYLLFQKNGKKAGQSVPHVHFHYVPVGEENSGLFKFFFRYLLTGLRGPLAQEEMQEDVSRFGAAMQ